MNIIQIDPRPAQKDAMRALLQSVSKPVIGIEFTLRGFEDLLDDNIDPQHSSNANKAAIEVAATYPIPAESVTYVVVRPDADALGAIAVIESRREFHREFGEDTVGYHGKKAVEYIAKQDKFANGEWPGQRDPNELNTSDSVQFAALNKLGMNPKQPIYERMVLMFQYVETGTCDGLGEAIQSVESENRATIEKTYVIQLQNNIAVIESTVPSALPLQIGYCYAPVVILSNPSFHFPGVDGEHTKYTIAQYKSGHIDLPAIKNALNAMEQNGSWGGSFTIIGSPQGVSSSLSLPQVAAVVEGNH